MSRILVYLLLATMLAPFITGTVAVASGFGDPWGMGAQNGWGVFVTAALPVFPPGIYQVFTWPLTFGVAVLLSPLALLRQPRYYLIAVLAYASVLSAAWVLAWVFDPDRLNMLWGAPTYDDRRLDSVVWKFGVILLTHLSIVMTTVCVWFRRSKA